MNTTEILKNIAQRCGGDVYLGIVGPVRVGKSTFIKGFMEKAVIPYVNDEYEKARMIDELPQAGVGKTIMTTEPKFVPNNAALIEFEDGFNVNVRLVDCVGYVIPEAKGYKDEDGIRMVRTPWSDEPVPFNEAAKMGTQKVIQDHSTIGIVITTDGSITDLSREAYIEAEAEVIDELKELGKPFIVIVNSANVNSASCSMVVEKLREKYGVPVLAMAVNKMSESDVHDILREALYEFPVSEININIPQWIAVLSDDHWLKQSFNETIQKSMSSVDKLREVENITQVLNENEYIDSSNIATIDTGEGVIMISTPQPMVSMIVSKAVNMCKMMNIKVLGAIENMSYVLCPDCHKKIQLFDTDDTKHFLAENDIELLGELPMTAHIAKIHKDDDFDTSSQESIDQLVKPIIDRLIQHIS